MRYHHLLFFSFLFLFFHLSVSLSAQSLTGHLSLTGRVIDLNGAPIKMASISLSNAKDSSLFKGSLTDDNGNYAFNHLPPGDFIVRASFVGYAPVQSKEYNLADTSGVISILPLVLVPSTQMMNGVTITAARPLIDHEAGKTIVHVDNSILAVGNNALEILDRAPGISVDENNHISLHGKTDVVVMINDKPTYLTADQLASLLSATDGGRIESIEIMTTPSANYGASGGAGLINIRLKKPKDQGMNGSLTVGGGYGHYGRDNTTLNLDYGHGKLNLFGSVTHRDSKGFENITIDRLIHQGNDVTAYDQVTNVQTLDHNNSLRAGADYDLSAHQTIGIGFSGYLNSSNSNLSDITTIGKIASPIDSLLHTKTNTTYTFHNYSLNLNDRYKLDNAGETLSIDLDYSHVNNNSDFRDTNRYFLPNGALLHDPQVLTNQTPAAIRIYVAKADYVKPVTKTFALEAGVKVSKVSSNNDLEAQVLQGKTYINDTTRTNHFLYQEQIYGGYLNLKGSLKTLDFQAGVRAEYTRSDGNLIGSTSTKRNYLDFFPSLSLSQPLDAKDNVSFSYSRRIDRPAYDNLNPFVYVLDPYTADVGNAFLNPQYTNAFELGYLHNQAFSLTMGYSRTTHAIMEVVITQGNISYQTDRNIDLESSWNIDANVPYTITKWWNGNVDLNGFYNRFKSDTLAGSSIRTGKPAFAAKARQEFKIGVFRSEVQVNYKSANTDGIINLRSQFYTDLAISRSFLEKRASLSFAVSDVFRTRLIQDESHLLNNDFTFKYRYDSRIFRLNFNYKFGNDRLKKHQQRNGAEDETGRVKQSS